MGKKLSAYNLYMQKALKGKMTGKTKAQREAIFKAAARGWNKGKPKPTSRSKPKSGGSSKSSSKTGGRRLGKNTFSTQKLFGLLRKAALVAPALGIYMKPLTNEAKIREGIRAYTSYDYVTGTHKLEHAAEGWMPYIYTSIITYGVPKIISIIKGLF